MESLNRTSDPDHPTIPVQYAIVLAGMKPGYQATQAGHAFLASYLNAPPALRAASRANTSDATKITLVAPNAHALIRTYNAVVAAGLPAVLWAEDTDEGGREITAVGIGPAYRAVCRPFTREYPPM